MEIIWTKHAQERQKEWARRRGITRKVVEGLLMNPEQTVPGDQDAQVAQTKKEGGLLRVPFIRTEEGCKILTVYWTSKVDKYWKEEPNANSL